MNQVHYWLTMRHIGIIFFRHNSHNGTRSLTCQGGSPLQCRGCRQRSLCLSDWGSGLPGCPHVELMFSAAGSAAMATFCMNIRKDRLVDWYYIGDNCGLKVSNLLGIMVSHGMDNRGIFDGSMWVGKTPEFYMSNMPWLHGQRLRLSHIG